MSFTQKFDNFEISLRREIATAVDAAESAVALSRENKYAIDELKQEIVSMKYEHKQETHALLQEQVKQRLDIESLMTDNKEFKSECVAIKTQTNNMETYSRRDNLLLHGVNQPENECGLLCANAVRIFMIDQLQFSDDAATAVQFVRCHK